MTEKPHIQRLLSIFEMMENGELTVKVQDGLPVKVIKLRSERENIDLTREQ